MGTDNGLCRYDGYDMRVFRNNPNSKNSIGNNVVRTIFEDVNGFLWIGTDGGGLNIYDPATEKFIRYLHEPGSPASISSNRIFSICEDSEGIVYLGTYGGQLDYIDIGRVGDNYEELEFHSINLYEGYNNMLNGVLDVSALHVDQNQKLWIGTSGDGVFVLPLSSFHSSKRASTITRYSHIPSDSKSISGNTIQAFHEDSGGNIWIGTEFSGFNRFQAETENFLRFSYEKGDEAGTGSNSITSFLEDSSGRFWVGSRGGGIMLFDKINNRFVNYTESPGDLYSIKGNLINTIYEDKFGNIWMGMVSTGVNLINRRKQQFEHYYHVQSVPQSLKGQLVKSILVDSKDNLWIGTYNGGLNLHTGGNSFTHFLSSKGNPKSLSNDNVQKIYEDRKGNIWIGTDGGGLNRFDPKAQTFTNFRSTAYDTTSLSGNSVWCIEEDSKGNLWVGTSDGGLNLYRRDQNTFKRYLATPNTPNNLVSNDIRVISEDRLGTLWIGTYGGGLSRFNPQDSTFETFKHNPKLSNSINNDKITTIFESLTTGQLWIGTFGGGVSKFDRSDQTFKAYTEEDGLSNNMVKSIEEDFQGNLWISTQKGISLFDPKQETFYNYSTNDGLQDDAFSLGASFKDQAGAMYFGGANGFNKFYPKSFNPSFEAPDVQITEFVIQNNRLYPRDTSLMKSSLIDDPLITLPYQANSFYLKFAAINFSYKDNVQYAYRLLGEDKDWLYSNADMRKVTYSNLWEGDYLFEVKARIGNSPWSYPSRLKLLIRPPLARSELAYLCYLAISALLIWWVRRIIRARINLQNQLRTERLERRKVKEINEFKLNFFTSISHEIRTPLTLIKGPVEELLETENNNSHLGKKLLLIHSNTNRLLSLVNQVLNFQKYESEKTELNISRNDLVEFIHDLIPYFRGIANQKNIQFRVNSNYEKIIAYFDRNQMEKVIFNLLLNAFKFTSENGKIDIHITAEGSSFSIIVEDNGIGIPEKHWKYIFDRFYQVENDKKNDITSSGLGLAIAKEIVELHSGTIRVISKPNEYTKFEVVLPDNKETSSPVVDFQKTNGTKLRAVDVGLTEAIGAENGADMEEPRQVLLIIDDNVDISGYLSDIFRHSYHVLSANDPTDGLGIAYEEIPDLIILDIMMPGMDGLTVCRKLKENIKTSHIPIVLLTAKESIASRLQGYQTGADEYITKPFDLNILKTRIRNLIDTRQKLRELFRENLYLEPQELTLESQDRQFLQNVMKVMEENIPNQEFTVDSFAKEVGLSRAVFYRKLPALTGYTPNDFIRIIRLKRAAQLLKDSSLTIKEISFLVGFNTPKYFSMKFRQEYGKSPVEYVNQFATNASV